MAAEEHRLLDIIIPHGGEGWPVCRRMFDMMRSQLAADFGAVRVILVHDNCEPWPYKCLEGLPIRVDEHRVWMVQGGKEGRQKAGVSAARNFGLKKATAPWVMFCDADDCFATVWALHCILDALRSPQADLNDLLWMPFYVETDRGRDLCGDLNWIFVHGKIYRREFLEREGIRFSPALYYAEDSAFNSTVEAAIDHDRIGEIKTDAPLYVWVWNRMSVTSRPENAFRNLLGLFDRHGVMIAEYLRRGLKDDAWALAAKAAADGWYQCQRKDLSEPQRTALLQTVAGVCAPYADQIRDLPPETWKTVWSAAGSEATRKKIDGAGNPDALFPSWFAENIIANSQEIAGTQK